MRAQALAIPGAIKIKIVSNFFGLSQSPVNRVWIYSISFSPDIDSENRYLRNQLLINAEAALVSQLGKFICTGSNIISKVSTTLFSVESKAKNGTEFIIIITPSGKINDSTKDIYKMYANSMLKNAMKLLDLKQITRMPIFFDSNHTQHIEQYDLQVWRGYNASFSHNMKDMLLKIDFSSKIVRKETALELIHSIRPPDHQEINSALSGKVVMADYGTHRCYRIVEVMFDMSPQSDFQERGCSTYADYYKTCYHITISSMRQPLLKVRAGRGPNFIYLIPELCRLTGVSDAMRKDYRVMSDIAIYTRLEPNKRLEVSLDLARKLANDKRCEEISKHYRIRINATPTIVDCYRFNKEIIKTGPLNEDVIRIDNNNSFTLSSSVIRPVPIDRWVVLVQPRDEQLSSQLIRALSAKAMKIHFPLSVPSLIEYHPSTLKSIISSLDISIQIALIILPPNDTRMYNDIKQACTLSSGIPTQCIRSNNLLNQKKSESVISKLLVQILSKTGSHLWQIAPTPGIPLKTMVIGMDVFHDTVQKNLSVLAFLASIHPAFTSYFNTTRFHRSGQEIAMHAGECLKEALLAFFEATKRKFLPELIIVYRDGVGHGQIEAVKLAEVQSMKNSIATFEGYTPRLVYVLVNKRTNAKFFERVGGKIENPQPGTVVMNVVVPDENSFYLISHQVAQGMARPTLYRVIDNESDMEITTIARLAFKLCYMYYNWTGGIKVPAPTMMAHKLAFIVGQSVHSTYLERLNTLPWFL